MSRGSRLWEAQRVVFYEVERLQEVLWRLEVTNVSRIVSLGGSIYCILRGLEAPGSPDSNVAKVGSGPPLKPFARLRRFGEDLRRLQDVFWRLEVTNVSRILALGSSKCRILRGLEAPRSPDSNGAKRPGGSA